VKQIMRRLAVFACAVVATACLKTSTPTQPTASLGTPFDLKVGQTAVLEGGLTIRFDAVPADSRCPMDAICVWAGEARVAMTLSARSAPRVQREWKTSPANDQVSYEDYSIKLTGLQPYPQGGRTISQGDYVATLTVIKP
jgi:hypothetical protein